jgi:hypothetical protein
MLTPSAKELLLDLLKEWEKPFQDVEPGTDPMGFERARRSSFTSGCLRCAKDLRIVMERIEREK